MISIQVVLVIWIAVVAVVLFFAEAEFGLISGSSDSELFMVLVLIWPLTLVWAVCAIIAVAVAWCFVKAVSGYRYLRGIQQR